MTSEDQSLDLSQDSQDEEGNISSSESECHQVCESSEHQTQRPKRDFSETESLDDSGVSSSGGRSPPLSTEHFPESNFRVSPSFQPHFNPHPRLHRPWADSPSPSRTQEPVLSTFSSLQHQHLYPYLISQQHLAALELSKIHQIQRYQSHLLKKFHH